MGNLREIIRLEKTESSNLVALELGEKGAASGTVVVAESQTAGRGRLNRTWHSPPGTGLYFSIILRPHLKTVDLPKITLASGLALCKAIESETALFPKIKWPNDLLLDGRKFGGILTETGVVSNSGPGSKSLVVVGVGLNLYPPENGFIAELLERATTLSETASGDLAAEKLLEACVTAIEKEVQRLEKGDFQKILLEWSERDAVYGKRLTWVTPKGEAIQGFSLGLDANGLLRVKDGDGVVHAVISGDVKLAGKILE